MVGHYSERITGNSIVDAYFGPLQMAPDRQERDASSDELLHELVVLLEDCSDNMVATLRRDYMLGEIDSMRVVVEWLAGEEMSYGALVEGLFGIEMKRFSDSDLDAATDTLRGLLSQHPGDDLKEKVEKFYEQGRIRGEDLRQLIVGELQQKAKEVGDMFRNRIFSVIGEAVTDNGVEYKTVQNEPWSGYNYYQGNYRSLNCFNIDRPFNKDNLLGVVYHEYEHHVSNLWREKAYEENKWTELSIVPLHTGRCVISEGTADTAKDFLEVSVDDPRKRIVDALYVLRRMVSINAAIMLNREKREADEVVDFLAERGLRPRKDAEGSLDFIRPTRSDGRPNLWAPYVFNYFVGRTQFVMPAYEKAKSEDELKRFFQTVYLNPFSLSSRTWFQAFDWL
jgi:hypothetical protein